MMALQFDSKEPSLKSDHQLPEAASPCTLTRLSANHVVHRHDISSQD
jgi:hypothetical protein